jgi:hypothetical protein
MTYFSHFSKVLLLGLFNVTCAAWPGFERNTGAEVQPAVISGEARRCGSAAVGGADPTGSTGAIPTRAGTVGFRPDYLTTWPLAIENLQLFPWLLGSHREKKGLKSSPNRESLVRPWHGAEFLGQVENQSNSDTFEFVRKCAVGSSHKIAIEWGTSWLTSGVCGFCGTMFPNKTILVPNSDRFWWSFRWPICWSGAPQKITSYFEEMMAHGWWDDRAPSGVALP